MYIRVWRVSRTMKCGECALVHSVVMVVLRPTAPAEFYIDSHGGFWKQASHKTSRCSGSRL